MGHHKGGTASSPAKRERYHHGDLRRELLRVAREEVATNGAADVSLASLARLAGVAPSAPYRHFADRRALLEAVAAEGFAALTQAMRDAMARRPASRPAAEALAHAYVRFGEDQVELYRLMFSSRLTPEAPGGSALDDAAGEAFALLRTTVAPGGGGVERRAYRTWAQIHGLVMLKADGLIASPLGNYV